MSNRPGIMTTSSPPLALDLVLKSFLKSAAFNEQQEKNWPAIARLIPGTTPKQVQRRYEELYQQNVSTDGLVVTGRPHSQGSAGTQRGTTRGESDQRLSRPGSAKFKGNKSDKDSTTGKSDDKRPSSADQSPVMVIHVCDEAKNLRQDFQCPRDLLVREMRYFAEYLTTDAQRWEEVDISVHCDVQIFDWLMNYVKRTSKDAKEPPKLEPNNVISILISSDFLKMDNLVSECIKYCHENMTAIVSTPCNMNCINDKLVSRISDLFNHNEADMIKDRKDKFKSKLFAKKLERLFDVEATNPDSPESAATLFRCGICRKLLTKTLEKKVSCMQSRLQIDREGKLTYSHMRDANWDVNDHLIDLKQQLKTWRDVYWRVWGTINSLTCSRCRDTFPCTELGHCRYHPETAVYDISILENSGGVAKSVIGVYPCCEQKNLRFDPTQPNTGCKVRDHVVNLGDTSPITGSSENVTKDPSKNKVYDDLLAHRDAVCIPYSPLVSHTKEDTELNIFYRDEQATGLKDPPTGSKSDTSQVDDHSKVEVRPQPRLQALTVERSFSKDEDIGMGESEDELGDDEENKGRKPRFPRRSKVTVDPQAILLDAPDFGSTKMRKWDSSRSMRWNQDAQREEDQRRMNEIINYLTKLRVSNDKMEKQKQKEYFGGLYSKLEAQWKAINMPPPRTAGPQIRSKPRLNTLKSSLV